MNVIDSKFSAQTENGVWSPIFLPSSKKYLLKFAAFAMRSASVIVNFLLFFVLLSVFPCNAFDADEDVLFKLYKRDNPKKFTILTVNRSRIVSDDIFDPELPTRIHIHGFLPKDEIIDRYRDLYLSNGDYNFIVVDWSEGAYTVNYYLARRRVKEVNKFILRQRE